jgi:para-nitrobenzyl esterase
MRNGVLEARTYSPNCPQVTLMGSFAGPAGGSEDCLYLNIFAPSDRKAPKPVIVWIHGGGNKNGSGADYDGTRLAGGGPFGSQTVVVTINYRLGLFGYFSNPGINGEGHLWGNYGIMDQQQALRWIRKNIAAFGGDPDNITISGQSSGAANSIVHMISPISKGLFDKAILQSGPPVVPDSIFATETGESALSRGRKFGEDSGCGEDATCLRHLSTARILQLQGTASRNGPYVGEYFIDGTIITGSLTKIIESGKYNHVPVLGGTTRDEASFFTGIDAYDSGKALDAAQYEVNNRDFLQAYPLSKFDGDPSLAQTTVQSDMIGCAEMGGVELLARTNGNAPVYAYEFSYRDAPYYFPKMPNPQAKSGNLRALAAHTIDIQFLFPDFHGGNLGVNLDQSSGQPRALNAAEQTLSNQMVGMWTNFARSADPSLKGQLRWPAFTPVKPLYLDQNIALSINDVSAFKTKHNCSFWSVPSK